MKITGIIPSRFQASRLPGKPLLDIGGKTMILRVYEQALKARKLHEVIVATDDERIRNEIVGNGGRAVMTGSHHQNGTERCYEAMLRTSLPDAVINIQGDEPFIDPNQIDLICACLDDKKTEIATLIKPERDTDTLENPARVKVVISKDREALYFSRSIIPFDRSGREHITYYKHIGLYGYRTDVLAQLVSLPPTPLETAESLEQLRWLENGYRIKCALTDADSISVDTPEDYQRIIAGL